jgi:hypothetical protein
MEFLVLLACLQNTGCSETSTAYYQTNAEFKAYVDYAQDQVERRLPQDFVEYGAPIIYASTGRAYTLKFSDKVALKGGPGWTHYVLSYSYSF